MSIKVPVNRRTELAVRFFSYLPPGFSEAALPPHRDPSLALSDGASHDAKAIFLPAYLSRRYHSAIKMDNATINCYNARACAGESETGRKP